MSNGPVPDDAWRHIVEHVPISSVDLVVLLDGGLLLGRRTNEPVKGEWFVPGGTVFKNETLEEALQRVAREELGTTVTVRERLGTYEHFYDTADVKGVDSKHYIATAFVVTPDSEEVRPDDQHSAFQVFRPPFEGLHPYVRRYVDALDGSYLGA